MLDWPTGDDGTRWQRWGYGIWDPAKPVPPKRCSPPRLIRRCGTSAVQVDSVASHLPICRDLRHPEQEVTITTERGPGPHFNRSGCLIFYEGVFEGTLSKQAIYLGEEPLQPLLTEIESPQASGHRTRCGSRRRMRHSPPSLEKPWPGDSSPWCSSPMPRVSGEREKGLPASPPLAKRREPP